MNAEDPTETGSYGSTLDTSTFGVMARWKALDKALTPNVHGSIGWIDNSATDGVHLFRVDIGLVN